MSDFDKNRDRKKKFYPQKERDPALRRPFILAKSDREKDDKDKVKDKPPIADKEKQPTILMKPREPSAPKEAEGRPQSPKKTSGKETDIDIQVVHPTKIAQNDSKDKKADVKTASTLSMKMPQKLVDLQWKLMEEVSEFNNSCQDYLMDNNTNFLVVGIVGTQGVGKSTIMSLLAHSHNMDGICNKILTSHELSNKVNTNEKLEIIPSEKIASTGELKFKSQDIEQIELGQHCTNGVDMYVTSDRVILLDTQPAFSASVMDGVLAREGIRETRTSTVNLERTIHVESLQLTSFLLAVCHVVIVVQDWFVDSNIIRFIRASEILKPSLTVSTAQSPTGGHSIPGQSSSSSLHEQSDPVSTGEHHPHVLFLHNRCTLDDYKPDNLKIMQDIYKQSFKNSKLRTTSGMYMYSAETKENADGSYAVCHNLNSERCGSPINFFLMPEIPEDHENKNIYRGHPSVEELAQRLRYTVFGAAKIPLTNIPNFSEKNWLQYAAKAWDTIRKCTYYMEYSRLMP